MSRRGVAGSGAGGAALAFVLLTLVALVVVPVAVQYRVVQHRDAIETSEPARTLLARLQFLLVRELAALEDVLVSGGAEGGASYDEARAAEAEIVRELDPLIARLGPTVRASWGEARALAERWHTRVEARRRDTAGPDTRGAAPPATEPVLLEDVLRATAAVDSAILSSTRESREEIAATEQLGLILTFALGLLALLAAGVVAVLYGRVRRFASESARRREEAEAALAEAARAEEARTRVLRGVTHDVKNPLGAAKGYAELLTLGVNGPLAPEQVPLVQGIQRTIDGALTIIADLLDIARADGGSLAVRWAPADVAAVALAAAEDHRAAAEAAGHRLELDPAPGPLVLETDAARVRQVLDNLLSNAVKYTPPPGRITVAVVELHGGRRRADAWVAVRVSDTGPGIPPERRESIFDEFARLHDGTGVVGHGLGLAIARRIARLLGGDLSVVDRPGPGATFELRLPREAAPPAGERWPGAPGARVS